MHWHTPALQKLPVQGRETEAGEKAQRDNSASFTLGVRRKSMKNMDKKSFQDLGVELRECYVMKRKSQLNM